MYFISEYLAPREFVSLFWCPRNEADSVATLLYILTILYYKRKQLFFVIKKGRKKTLIIMSVLMFIDLAGDGQWPSGYSVNRFASIAASNGDGRRPVAVFAYSRPETTLVDAVAQEFALSACHGHRVRAVLVGVRDHRLAERLYRERGLPVNVVFGTPEVDVQWSDALGRFRGITMSGWLRPRPTLDDGDENDEDVVTSVVDALNNLSDCYQSYTAGLRDVPSFAAHCGPSSLADYAPAYTAIADAFGDGVQDVEPLLDAMLEELCGAAGNTNRNNGDYGDNRPHTGTIPVAPIIFDVEY